MQYKVPQNVDIEDKVIAGLTLRQFMFLMIAGGAVLILYFFVGNGPISFMFYPMALVVAGIGIAFAFAKINDRPFEVFIISATKTILTPGIRIWQKDTDPVVPEHKETKQTRASVRPKKSLRDARSSLEQLATVIDSGGVAGASNVEGRATNIQSNITSDEPGVDDVLAKTEEKGGTVDAYIKQADSFVKTKAEPTVGQIATKETAKDEFKYDQLNLADDSKIDDAVEKIHEKQKKLKEDIETAQVEKFNHDQ